MPFTVVEGDQETSNDAQRIRATGVPAVQVNTGTGCHLEAEMLERALPLLEAQARSIVMIENVGNLVCPALFDLGEKAKVVILSVTEGEDKPLKYPLAFRAARYAVISKIDLLPHLEFDLDQAMRNVRSVNPETECFLTSTRSGHGLDRWFDLLRERAGVRAMA